MKIFLKNLKLGLWCALSVCVLTAALWSDQSLKKVLVVYDQEYPAGALYDLPASFQNLLSHFDVQTATLALKDYRKGLVNLYDVIFYVGADAKEKPNLLFNDDIVSVMDKKTVCWVFAGAQSLINAYPQKFGFRIAPQEFGFSKLYYQSQLYDRLGEDVFMITNYDRKKIKLIGSHFRNDEQVPFAVKQKKFWYISDLPLFMSSSSYIFADLLHDILEEYHPASKQAFIRIEDVHPKYRPEMLRNLGKTFKKYHVPFAFAVIPVYQDQKQFFTMAERPYFVSALRYLQTVGGTAILHGYNHANQNITGEGFEFWNVQKDKAFAGMNEEQIRKKIEDALELTMQSKIYPLAWETPHYAASQLSYRILGEYFSTAVERLQISDKSYKASQNFPYLIKDRYGRFVIPENLGYYSEEEGLTIEQMLAEAKKMLVVRDAIAVGFFHPWMPPEKLEELIKGLKKMGFDFLDMRDLPNQVKSPHWVLYSGLPNMHDPEKNGQFFHFKINPLQNVKLDYQKMKAFVVNPDGHENIIDFIEEPSRAHTLFEIPATQKGIFVMKLTQDNVQMISTGSWLKDTFLGKQSMSWFDSVLRIMMWVFFVTNILFVMGLFIVFALKYISHRRQQKMRTL